MKDTSRFVYSYDLGKYIGEFVDWHGTDQQEKELNNAVFELIEFYGYSEDEAYAMVGDAWTEGHDADKILSLLTEV